MAEYRADKRYAYGAAARREGKARLASHLQPCLLAYCRRPECRGWLEEDGRIRAQAADRDTAQDEPADPVRPNV